MTNGGGCYGPEEEDIYGRCTNIKLTTFSEQNQVETDRSENAVDKGCWGKIVFHYFATSIGLLFVVAVIRKLAMD